MNAIGSLAAAIVLSLLAARPVAAASARVALPVMGTVLEVTVVADDPSVASTLAQAALERAREWDDVLTTWRAEGGLARLNRAAGHGPVEVDPRLAGALVSMLRLSQATGGAFDPSVGDIVTALRKGAGVPASRPHGGLNQRVRVTGSTVELTTGTQLDAGGIGKGIALDTIADLLQAGRARAWFLDFGGSSQLAHGRPEGSELWIVAVTGHAAGRVHGFIALSDASLSTSRASAANDPAGAIVDPRTGHAVAPPRVVSVIAPDATTADAWSTALIVLGRDGLEAARKAGVAALVDDVDGVSMTADFPLRSSTESR